MKLGRHVRKKQKMIQLKNLQKYQELVKDHLQINNGLDF